MFVYIERQQDIHEDTTGTAQLLHKRQLPKSPKSKGVNSMQKLGSTGSLIHKNSKLGQFKGKNSKKNGANKQSFLITTKLEPQVAVSPNHGGNYIQMCYNYH